MLAAWAASPRPTAGHLPAREHRYGMSRMSLARAEVSVPVAAGMRQPRRDEADNAILTASNRSSNRPVTRR